MIDVTRLVARTPLRSLQLDPAATGFLLTSTLMFSTSGIAYEFELAEGEVQGKLNTTISIGTKYDLKGYETPDSNEQLENDGDRSFDGGFVSKALKLTSELELSKDNYGLYARGTAYYDDVIMNGKNKWADNNASDVRKGLLDETGTFNGWSDEVKDNQGRGVKLQSAYVFGDWKFDNGQKLSLKLGSQTHNWGETIFYGGGLMDLNAYDMALATLPGSDGDLLLPQGMLQADFQFNNQLTLSAFTQYNWEASIAPGRGTFGSEEDIFVPGTDFAHYKVKKFSDLAGPDIDESAMKQIMALTGIETTADFLRVADTSGSRDASNSGQWGLRLTFEPESLEDTQFAIYYANYHSSIPMIDYEINENAAAEAIADIYGVAISPTYTLDPTNPNDRIAGMLAGVHVLNNNTYASTVYPEDIKLWGASFHTKVFGYTQIAGELTYRENAPIWIDHPEDLLSMALLNSGSILQGTEYSASHVDPTRQTSVGQVYQNFERVPMWDGSLSVIQPFGAVLGTDLMYVVAEAAFSQVSGLDNYDRYVGKGSNDWFGEDPEKNANDRLDRFSWGYNLMLGANWNDVYTKGLNLESTIRFTHDVKGNSHFTGRFEEGEQKLNFGLTAKYGSVVARFSWQGEANNLLRKGVLIGSLGYTF